MSVLKTPSAIGMLTGILMILVAPMVFACSQAGWGAVPRLLFSYQYLGFIAFFGGLYWLFSQVVIPRFYTRPNYLVLATVILLAVALAVYLHPFDNLMSLGRQQNNPPHFHEMRPPAFPDDFFKGKIQPHRARRQAFIFDIISVFLVFMVVMLALSAGALKKWQVTEQRAARAEADKANAELSFLKAQINPHFLFNTLNNIYSLAVNDSTLTAEAVMRLSKIMRYVTDDAAETLVPLELEINCIRNYISLQQLRLGEKCKIDFLVNGNTDNRQVPPLVLMNFVENAFKHGISNHEGAAIAISIEVLENGIRFFIQNKLFSTPRMAERTGIGIDNTKKRLHALYPGRHLLNIMQDSTHFSVELVLYDRK
jgi:two-component system, LytTR family, sensor kinase